MAKVFLDANILIDILENRKNIPVTKFDNYETYTSPLSTHILFYVGKKKVPFPLISEMLLDINLVNFSHSITKKALAGPSEDFEDNVQLHSAAKSECDLFITSDKILLAMKFFGKTQIISPENLE